MFRHKIGWRKKSTHASQYRVGKYGLTAVAEFSVTSTSLVTSAASAPRAAPRDESATVDKNSAIAPTPSMDTAMKVTAPRVRSSIWARVSPEPDSEVAATLDRPLELIPTGCEPKSSAPVAYAVSAISTTATRTNTMSATSLAARSRVRPTGRASKHLSMPEPASPAMESPATTATDGLLKLGLLLSHRGPQLGDPQPGKPGTLKAPPAAQHHRVPRDDQQREHAASGRRHQAQHHYQAHGGHAHRDHPAEHHHLAVQPDPPCNDGAKTKKKSGQIEDIRPDDHPGAQPLLVTGHRGHRRGNLRRICSQSRHDAQQRLRQTQPLADPSSRETTPSSLPGYQRPGQERRHRYRHRHPGQSPRRSRARRPASPLVILPGHLPIQAPRAELAVPARLPGSPSPIL